MNDNIKEFHCSSCGAKLVANSLVNVRCAYCGSVQIVKDSFNKEFIPDSIIRFKNTNSDVANLLGNFMTNSNAVPYSVKMNYTIKSITPVYVPYSVYSFGAEVYQKLCYIRSDEEHGTNVYYSYELSYEEKLNVTQDRSINVRDYLMYSIEPFDFSMMQKFNPSFLTGALSEVSDDNNFEKIALNRVKATISSQNEMDFGIIDGKISTIDNFTAYLPVWFVTVISYGNQYTFVMNDTTNKWVIDNNSKQKANDNNFLVPVLALLFLPACVVLSLIIFFIGFIFGKDMGEMFGPSMFLSMMIVSSVFALIGITYSKNKKKKKMDTAENTQDKFVLKPFDYKLRFKNKLKHRSDVPNGITHRFSLDGKQI